MKYYVLIAGLVFIINTIAFSQNTEYKSVQKGNQVWMTENLQLVRFRNGDMIQHAKSSAEWEAAGDAEKPAWCYFNNDPSTEKTYGKLYNWFAVRDRRGLAPEGWHIPSSDELNQLITFLQSKQKKPIYGKSIKPLKEKKGPKAPVQLSIQTGCRIYNGNFIQVSCNTEDCYGDWWTATEAVSYSAGVIKFLDKPGRLLLNNAGLPTGLFVRCIKN